MSFFTPTPCAGCGKQIMNEGTTNNDNSGRIWCSRLCRDATAAAPYHPAQQGVPVRKGLGYPKFKKHQEGK